MIPPKSHKCDVCSKSFWRNPCFMSVVYTPDGVILKRHYNYKNDGKNLVVRFHKRCYDDSIAVNVLKMDPEELERSRATHSMLF